MGIYMEIETSYLTRTGPGIKNCFCLHGTVKPLNSGHLWVLKICPLL